MGGGRLVYSGAVRETRRVLSFIYGRKLNPSALARSAVSDLVSVGARV